MGINIDNLNNPEASLLFDSESLLDNVRDLSTEELKITGGGGKGGYGGGRGFSGGGYGYGYGYGYGDY